MGRAGGATSFHTYRLNNVLLILAQRPDASRVAGFWQWQAKAYRCAWGEGNQIPRVLGQEDHR